VDYRDDQRDDDEGHSSCPHGPLTAKITHDECSETGDTDHYGGERSDRSSGHRPLDSRTRAGARTVVRPASVEFSDQQIGLVKTFAALRVTQSSLMKHVQHWCVRAGGRLRVIHDSSSALAKEKWAWDAILTADGPHVVWSGRSSTCSAVTATPMRQATPK